MALFEVVSIGFGTFRIDEVEMFKFVLVRDRSVRAKSCYMNKFANSWSTKEYRVFMAHP